MASLGGLTAAWRIRSRGYANTSSRMLSALSRACFEDASKDREEYMAKVHHF